MQAKVSVMLPVANPMTARVLVDLGADTLNLVTDLSPAQIAAIRAVTDVPIDVYIESTDDMGGFLRHHELPEIIRVAAPVYVKLGLANAPGLYPSAPTWRPPRSRCRRERVRRARLALELLGRSGYAPTTSERGAEGIALPVPRAVPAASG